MLAQFKQSWRIYLVASCLLMLLMILIYRMMLIQVLDGDGGAGFLQQQGDVRTVRNELMPANRGMITDRHGKPLAVSTPVVSVWVNPQELDVESDKLPVLANLLNISEFDLQQKISRYKSKQFLYLRRHLSPQHAQQVFDLGIQGVYSQNEYKRFYPAGEVAAHLVGYVDIDNKGLEGFEYSYNEWLQGKPGKKQVVKDLYQRTIKEIKQIKAAKEGKDLALTIDLRLQYIAYKALKESVQYHRANAGSIVLIDVDTAEVLAIANQPAFNPNNRKNMDIDAVRNRAVTDMFEPGSTAKPITMMAALESGAFSPDSAIQTSPGFLKLDKKTYLDPVNYGEIPLRTVLAKSSQVGTIKVALELEQQQLYQAFYRMGFGQYIGLGLPGESTGYLPNKSVWKPIEQAALSFGAGLSVTSLQLAQAYAVFADAGRKKPVSLVLDNAKSIHVEQVVDENVAKEIATMLAGVTSHIGTAKKANTEYYTVAGKTGTSHKVGAKGYESGQYISLFAGFAPAKQPKIAAIVMIDDPKGKEYYGGEVAAPVFATVINDSLRILGVTPDKISTDKALRDENLAEDIAEQISGVVW
ncbi:MAG: penicillin-binding protein 2 [Pseudomonadales bacterium]|nr:penicillin-binding protein 2 [Pseudomonadales bacterium]